MPNNKKKNSSKKSSKKKAEEAAAAATPSAAPPGKSSKTAAKDMFDESNWLVERRQDAKFGSYFVAKEDIKAGTLIGMDKDMVKVCLPCDAPASTNYVSMENFALQCSECCAPIRSKKAGYECPHHQGQCLQLYCSKKCQEWAWDHYHSVQNGEQLGQLVKYTMSGFSNTRLCLLFACKLIALYKVGKTKNAKVIEFIDTLLETYELPPMIKDEPANMDQLHQKVIEVASVFALGEHIVLAPNGKQLILGVRTENEIAAKDWPPSLPKPFHTTQGIVKCLALITSYCFADMKSMTLMGPTNFFNHSCVPNAATSFTDNVGEIEAIQDIPKGAQVFICYLNMVTTSRKHRRLLLKMQHGFICSCPLCLADDVANDAPTAICDYCSKTAKQQGVETLRNCSRCNNVRYCGREVRAGRLLCSDCQTFPLAFPLCLVTSPCMFFLPLGMLFPLT